MAFKEILRNHRRSLLSTVDSDDVLVEKLYIEHVINERQYQIVKSEKVPFQAAEKLLDFVSNSGMNGFILFCKALDEEYSWLTNEIKCDAEKIGIDLNQQVEFDFSQEIVLPASLQPVVPNECQLMRFSKILIRNDWQAVLYELGLQTADIDQCKRSHSLETMQCMSGLVLWLRRNGRAATFHVLFQACINADADRTCLSALVEMIQTN